MATVPNPDWTRLPYLTATILECLRLFPPISQLINRRVSQPTQLGGHLDLPAGTYVGYHSYATNRDPVAWGVTANEFEPLRWGTTHEQVSQTYRHVKARAEFISFHGGARACLGEKFAMLEMRTMLLVLVHRLQWRLDPDWTDRMAPVSGLFLFLLLIQEIKEKALEGREAHWKEASWSDSMFLGGTIASSRLASRVQSVR